MKTMTELCDVVRETAQAIHLYYGHVASALERQLYEPSRPLRS